MKLYDTLEAGQLRLWKFVRKGDVTHYVDANSREGKSFLVVGVEGVRCDTMQEGGGTESFYVQWLVSNSIPVN